LIKSEVVNEGLECPKCSYFIKGRFLPQHRCPKCGEPLLTRVRIGFVEGLQSVTTLCDRPSTYLSLGEGSTPLIRCFNTYIKLEHLNPTGSFKDRGASLAVALARELGYELVIEDSSGNAGLSVATYASAHGIRARVYVPSDIPEGKYGMLVSVGAEVIKAGTRDEAHDAAIKDRDGYYVGHVTNPYFIEGMKDIALEVIKQLSRVPRNIVVPVASGTLILGLWKGFNELLSKSLIKSLPKLIAVQASGYATLSKLVNEVIEVGNTGSNSRYADALRLTKAPRIRQVSEAVNASGGKLVIVGDDEGVKALKELWSNGLLVEPTSAFTYAATKALVTKNEVRPQETVTILTGSGLKYVSVVRKLLRSNN